MTELVSGPEGFSKVKEWQPVNHCNRHSNCKAAEEALLARNPGMTRLDISFSFHCHDDECEDCFGC